MVMMWMIRCPLGEEDWALVWHIKRGYHRAICLLRSTRIGLFHSSLKRFSRWSKELIIILNWWTARMTKSYWIKTARNLFETWDERKSRQNRDRVIANEHPVLRRLNLLRLFKVLHSQLRKHNSKRDHRSCPTWSRASSRCRPTFYQKYESGRVRPQPPWI